MKRMYFKNLVPHEIGQVYLSIPKILWLYSMIIPCFLIKWNNINTTTIALSIFVTILTICFGHSIGLHRGVIHKSYTTSKAFRNILLYLFVLTGFGGPLAWLKFHYYRDYWQNKKDCPRYFAYGHSLLKDFFWNLHLAFKPEEDSIYVIPIEDLEDKWLQFLEKTWVLHNIVFAVVLYLLTDLNSVLVLFFLRVSISILAHWYIGYASHKFGYAHYEVVGAKESGFNDVLLGLISFGEGLHNNHHAFPKSAKFSARWYEVDFGWYGIILLERCKLITNVVRFNEGIKKRNVIREYDKIFMKLPL